MQIKTRRTNDNISIKELKEAVKFYGDLLLHPKTLKTLSLTVVFKPMEYKGMIEWVDRPVKPREFLITISDKYKRKEILLTLAHEMVHLKQYVLGELKDQTTKNNVRWKNQEIVEERIDYFDLPYEVEAYGREWGMYKRFNERKPGQRPKKVVYIDHHM